MSKSEGRVTAKMHRAAMVYMAEHGVAVTSQHMNGALYEAMAAQDTPGLVALADIERMVDFGLSAHDVLDACRKLAAGGVLIHGNAPGAAPADSNGAGLPVTQEPKYSVTGTAIVNRRTGAVIPADEPVFIFRAKDAKAREALEAYACVLLPGEHRDAVVQRVSDFAAFAFKHPERMKAEPDTEAGGATVSQLSRKDAGDQGEWFATVEVVGGEPVDYETVPGASLPDGSHRLYTRPAPTIRGAGRRVSVCAGALQMVRLALGRDAAEGKVSRGEMLAELDKGTLPLDDQVAGDRKGDRS